MNKDLNPAPDERRIWTVSRLNLEAQGLLEGGFPLLWIEAELSNLSRPASGHLYFSLKDDRAQVSGAMFRNRAQLLRFTPRDGMQVLVRARVTLYVPRGNYQLVIEHMEEAGEGRLRREFEQLREKLRAEGLFDDSRKRTLPAFPRQIGVITSATGAALRDILQVLKRRAPQLPVLIYPAAVQGKDAPGQLIAALALANRRQDCDVLIMARGGGSLEDLWAFNDEQLAREVAASSIPVVSAVGHEVDVGLTDYVADLRAPTPSAAAELVSPDLETLGQRVATLGRRLAVHMQHHLQREQQRLGWLEKRLGRPEQRLQQVAQQIDELEARLRRHLQQRLALPAQRLDQLKRRLHGRDPRVLLSLSETRLTGLAKRLALPLPRQVRDRQRDLRQLSNRLNSVSPLAVLGRGYSITFHEGQALHSVAGLQAGHTIQTRLRDGEVLSTVTELKPLPDNEPAK
ncbi:exodeoxyribonuclease VII large subunit [Alcanivorax sp. 1008]|uniref:exodeoxyribonuclease VII large subunit n=1 Tax=Alcanivorax sp. 1008 TaxID=2816853 RepID=UPI001D549C0B|nr:exodeoxyribonuclease VII large subunit [Alcanivorax sp. 1008]MCC1497293.1 exodeoxyribonuclease VII large subunit [Alcanivorax sp. 1008]